MKKIWFILLIALLYSVKSGAQDNFSYSASVYKIPLWQSGNFGNTTDNLIQWDDDFEAPMPAGDYWPAKLEVNKQRAAYDRKLQKAGNYISKPSDIVPIIDTSFNGQIIGSRGIPNDNHMAISNAGKIVSVQNSSIRVLDENGSSLLYKTLFSFANGKVQGLTNYCYDPKVVYDPIADRFILFFLHESTVAANFGVIAFSATNDPTGAWNFYKIPGNAIKNDKWSDYPIMAISKEDVFVTLNLLTENTDWRVGFNQSLIWQINKQGGYNGDTLTQKVYSNITFKNKAIWSICPVQSGFLPNNTNMYFLSVRPGDKQNDTLFLHEITNTLKSGTASLKLSVFKTDKKYGVPPAVPQPKGGDTLQTNDTRVLGGIVHNNYIQYVQTTVTTPAYKSGVFHGMFDIFKDTIVTCNYIKSDTMDFGYPSICYAGKGTPEDQASVITFSSVSSKQFPGTAAVYHTRSKGLPSLFSEVVTIKKGVSYIERLPFAQYPHERWGDYTGIQYQYNKPGIVWLVGSYGNETSLNGTWIGKLKVTDKVEVENTLTWAVYPNPVAAKTTVSYNLDKDESISFELVDGIGKLVKEIYTGKPGVGYHELAFQSDLVAHGTYILLMRDSSGKVLHYARLLK